MFYGLIYLFHLGLFTRDFVQHVRMGFFMLLKLKQKPLDAWPQRAPGIMENEKQMLSTKSCFIWKTGSRKSARHNNAASLWSRHNCASTDLRIDDDCKRSSTMALPGVYGLPIAPPPRPPPPLGLRAESVLTLCPPSGHESRLLSCMRLVRSCALLFSWLFRGGWK